MFCNKCLSKLTDASFWFLFAKEVYCNEKNVDLFDSLFFSYVFLD